MDAQKQAMLEINNNRGHRAESNLCDAGRKLKEAALEEGAEEEEDDDGDDETEDAAKQNNTEDIASPLNFTAEPELQWPAPGSIEDFNPVDFPHFTPSQSSSPPVLPTFMPYEVSQQAPYWLPDSNFSTPVADNARTNNTLAHPVLSIPICTCSNVTGPCYSHLEQIRAQVLAETPSPTSMQPLKNIERGISDINVAARPFSSLGTSPILFTPPRSRSE